MKKVLLATCMLTITLSACSRIEKVKEVVKNEVEDITSELLNGETSVVEDDIKASLDGIKNGAAAGDIYIYGAELNSELNGNGTSITVNDDIAKSASYDVGKVTMDAESTERATAEITVTAPDTISMLEEIASQMTEYDVDYLLDTFYSQLDSGEYPTKEYEVTVELRCLNDHWYIVPNNEFSNAFSGGLVEEYQMMGQKIVDDLSEEGDGYEE